MLSQNDVRVGSFYFLDNSAVRVYDLDRVAFFRLGGDIISKDFSKLEGIPFDANWKKKISSDCAIALWKYAYRQFVHEVQRDYFNDFGKELRFNINFNEDIILA